jgi:hypothetical protein
MTLAKIALLAFKRFWSAKLVEPYPIDEIESTPEETDNGEVTDVMYADGTSLQ